MPRDERHVTPQELGATHRSFRAFHGDVSATDLLPTQWRQIVTSPMTSCRSHASR